MKTVVNIFWFRRDLRLHDNTALSRALQDNLPLVPLFIFDRNILDKLEEKTDRRVEFIHQALINIRNELFGIGVALEVHYGYPLEVFSKILLKYHVRKVFANHDYEPYANERDGSVAAFLGQAGASLHSSKDQVIFEKNEVVKDDGTPYTVFTPYSRKWKSTLQDLDTIERSTEPYFKTFYRQQELPMPSIEEMGFRKAGLAFPSAHIDEELMRHYHERRDFPSINGTSKLSVHLRFGTISIRTLVRKAKSCSETFLNELIWREFYQMILWQFPQVGKGKAFKPAYDFIQWRNNEAEFNSWCVGLTGYPIVDAGMRELNETGLMHNRLRMITASFLTKHLLIDWRWGEAYFAKRLLDFDLAANNGGWQWAAGSGCDAAPYFRIFNPTLQTQKFDPHLEYVRRWVPEFNEPGYPRPLVEHEIARKRCLEAYGKAVSATRI